MLFMGYPTFHINRTGAAFSLLMANQTRRCCLSKLAVHLFSALVVSIHSKDHALLWFVCYRSRSLIVVCMILPCYPERKASIANWTRTNPILCWICFTRLFRHFDPDNDEHLTMTELRGLILGLGIERDNGQVPDEEELQHWMLEFDVSRDNQISVDEFLQGIKRWMKSATVSFPETNTVEVNRSSNSEHHGWDFEAQVRI